MCRSNSFVNAAASPPWTLLMRSSSLAANDRAGIRGTGVKTQDPRPRTEESDQGRSGERCRRYDPSPALPGGGLHQRQSGGSRGVSRGGPLHPARRAGQCRARSWWLCSLQPERARGGAQSMRSDLACPPLEFDRCRPGRTPGSASDARRECFGLWVLTLDLPRFASMRRGSQALLLGRYFGPNLGANALRHKRLPQDGPDGKRSGVPHRQVRPSRAKSASRNSASSTRLVGLRTKTSQIMSGSC